MKKKTKKKRNGIAKALQSPSFKQKVIPNKKKKTKKINRKHFIEAEYEFII